MTTMHRNFINGHFVASKTSDHIPVLNPATGAVLSEVPDSSAGDVDAAVAAAGAAQPGWGKLAPIERARHLRNIAAGIRERAAEIARTITEEGGKVQPLADVEVAFTADYLDYMAEWARRIEGEIIPSDRRNENIFLFRAPIGIIGGILPWNFPFFLIARKMGPALVTGNTIVIKPSEETPNNAVAFCEIVAASGLPAGVFNIVHGRGATVGHALAAHRGIGMISMTGSVESGVKVMEAAAPNLTKVNLELGGKAPALVLADADLDLAATAIKNSRVINSGQVCNCAERIYVQRRVADEFTEKLVAAMKATRYGDPLVERDLDMGPLINARQLEKVDALVQGAVKAGAEVATGGRRAERSAGGNYYEPTVLTGVKQDMEIVRKETFGPVAPIVTFEDLDEGIAWANDSEYGLTSSIYTRSIDVAMRAANEIRFGETYINRENFEAMQGFHAGWRKSGIGGADGKHGLYEYTQTHVVYVQYNQGAKG
jgi:lactaldehyde dehydrogenase / glycolaldehyde dehydrogenase